MVKRNICDVIRKIRCEKTKSKRKLQMLIITEKLSLSINIHRVNFPHKRKKNHSQSKNFTLHLEKH
jgi:hypothetical protein